MPMVRFKDLRVDEWDGVNGTFKQHKVRPDNPAILKVVVMWRP